MPLRIVRSECQGAGDLSADSHSPLVEDYSQESLPLLTSGCVDIFGFEETSEAEKLEPLPLALEVGRVTVHGAAHHS